MTYRFSALAIVLLLAPFLAPAQDGPLGVIEVGAYADMLLVEGNPLQDVAVLADYENNIKVVVKDGDIYKNTL